MGEIDFWELSCWAISYATEKIGLQPGELLESYVGDFPPLRVVVITLQPGIEGFDVDSFRMVFFPANSPIVGVGCICGESSDQRPVAYDRTRYN